MLHHAHAEGQVAGVQKGIRPRSGIQSSPLRERTGSAFVPGPAMRVLSEGGGWGGGGLGVDGGRLELSRPLLGVGGAQQARIESICKGEGRVAHIRMSRGWHPPKGPWGRGGKRSTECEQERIHDRTRSTSKIQTLRSLRRTGTHVRRSACPWPGVPEEMAENDKGEDVERVRGATVERE